MAATAAYKCSRNWAAAAAGYPPGGGGSVFVRTAAQLVAAVADPAVQVAVLAGSVSLTEADWAPVAQPVVEVRRNLTLLGAYTAPTAWPVLNFGYTANLDGVGIVKSAKLRLVAGCTFTLRRLVLQNARDQPHFLFMGLDVFAESPAPNSTLASAWPIVVLREAALWQRSCLPLSLQGLSGRTIPRPVFLPGPQNGTGASVLRPPDCVNSSTATPITRCWPARGMYYDLAMYAYDPDAFNRQTPAGYALWLLGAPYWCDQLMTDECVAANGGYVGCHYSLYPYSRRAANTTTASGQIAANGTTSSSTGGSNAPAAGAPSVADGSGGDSGSPSVLAPVLGGVIGGLAGLAVIAAGLFAVMRLRRQRQPGAPKGSGDLDPRGACPGTAKAFEHSSKGMSGTGSAGSAPQVNAFAVGELTAATTQTIFGADCTESIITAEDEGALVPVTPLTPFQSHIPLDVKLGSGGGELRLLPVTLGKGAFGRVVQGVWCGRRVAVKLLHRGLFNAAAAAHGGDTAAMKAVAPAGGGGAAALPPDGDWPTIAVFSLDATAVKGGSTAQRRVDGTGAESAVDGALEAGLAPGIKAVPPGAAAAALAALAGAQVPAALSSALWWEGMGIHPGDVTALTPMQPAGNIGDSASGEFTAAGLAQPPDRQQGVLSLLQTVAPDASAGYPWGGLNGGAALVGPAAAGATAAVTDNGIDCAAAHAVHAPGPVDAGPGVPISPLGGQAGAKMGHDQMPQQRNDTAEGVAAVAAASPGAFRPLNLAHIRMGGSSVLGPGSSSGAGSHHQASHLQQPCLGQSLLSEPSSSPLVSSMAAAGGACEAVDTSVLGTRRNPAAGRALPPPPLQPLPSVAETEATEPRADATGDQQGAAAVPAGIGPGTGAHSRSDSRSPQPRRTPPGEPWVAAGTDIEGQSADEAATGGHSGIYGYAEPEVSTLDAAGAMPADRLEARLRGPLTHGGAVRRTMAQEVEVLARLQHANIVQLLAANLNPACPCLVVELMDTSLDKLLYGVDAVAGPAAPVDAGARSAPFAPRSQAPLLPLPKVLHIALQVARALAYLHPTIIHRDLKPANVLISDPGSASPVVKIADFGLSRLQDTVLITAHVDVGTAPYMAPEALDARNCVITHHSDMYSYGIMLYEMLAGTRPWRGLNMLQVAVAVCEKQRRPRLEDLGEARCPPALRALVSQCWDPVPERRPGAAEVTKQLAVMLLQQQQQQQQQQLQQL
ncbi:hypothetical protein HXX76_001080 [Chlamydomonas incerta]|uniref:Protein kinase domain-containing protein n=1 Tax=Chlamydomonas incerta TaxID=51695 RepID=A0A836B163_CHLIN|nr:hypothetical protein HXX76_001080 [Chlamydomonas incerta]|eukprot:KAG2444323.1 hypothetical protein HXX76_001080 [Chlamydomonas incerta]